MQKIRVIGAEIGTEECIPHAEILDENEEVIANVWGDRTIKIFAEALEMYDLFMSAIWGRLNDAEFERAQAIIERVEGSPKLTYDGISMQQLLDEVVWGGRKPC